MKRSPWKLSPLFSPHSIAVIGASPKGGAGSIVIRNLQRLGFAGTIHPVNPKYADVLGYPCHPSLETIPGPVDCAAVLLGDKAILPILKTAHARGVKGVWAFASGFAETGEQGAAMQREIRDFCRETGLLFCGPNCVGYANITDGVGMYSAPLPRAFRKGSIGVIAQSGAVLLALIAWSDSNMAGICFGDSKQQAFTLAGPHVSNVLSFEDPVAPLTVGTVDEFIEYFMARHSEARVDYVHDEPAVRALTRQGGVAFLLPPFEKSDLFKGIVMGGVLPRKTFSMGHAEEKRYYIECRRIKE